RNSKSDRLGKAHLRSIAVRITEARLIEQLFRHRWIIMISLAGRVGPRLFRQNGMRNLALAVQQITDDAFAIDGVRDCLPDFHVVERRLLYIERQMGAVRARELFNLNFRNLTERFDRSWRQTRWQRRGV